MAPEQWSGKGADARSDQFAFCVSLWEMLCGQRPFRVDMARGTVDWSVPESPRGFRLSARGRRVLLRGLSLDPAARFGSMDELLEQLAPERGRSRFLPVGIAAAVAATVLGAALASSQSRTAMCSGAGDALAKAMSPAQLDAAQRAFEASGRPNALATWQRVRAGLEAYGRAWAGAYREACEATRVRGEQPESILGLRMACLERRRSELAAFVSLVSQADGEVVDHAAVAVLELSDIGICSNVPLLKANAAAPLPPETREEVERVRKGLDEAKALLHSGKYADGLAKVAAAFETAHPRSREAVLGEALLARARLQNRSGALKDAEQSAFDSVRESVAFGDRELGAAAAIELADIIGCQRQERPEEASRWLAVAEALLDSLGERGELRARLLLTRGKVLGIQRRWPEASDAMRQAFATAERVNARGLAVADVQNSLARALLSAREYAQAKEALETAVEIYAERLGPEHDKTLGARSNLASVLLWLGHIDEALRILEETRAAIERALGPEHLSVAIALLKKGFALMEQRRFAVADRVLERCLAIREKVMGAETPGLSEILADLAYSATHAGRWAEASALFDRALAIDRRAFGGDAPRMAARLAGRGYVDAMTGRPKEGIALMQRALELAGPEQGVYGEIRRAQIEYYTARALASIDAARAHQYARQARETFASVGPRFDALVREIDGWLAEQRAAMP
jgi:tetratricopeptide (TPR) repeat protein